MGAFRETARMKLDISEFEIARPGLVFGRQTAFRKYWGEAALASSDVHGAGNGLLTERGN
jgi:hypothetical protein